MCNLLKCEVLRLRYFEEDEDREDDHHGEKQKEGVLLQSVLDAARKEQSSV